MADAREVDTWTFHAEQQWDWKEPPLIRQVTYDYVSKYVKKTDCVIDYGCGTGFFSHLFKDSSFIGMDQNLKMIEYAKLRNPGLFYLDIDWRHIPIFDNSIDVIFTSYVLQHNKYHDKDVVYKEFNRILKPGGYYICVENTLRIDNYQISFGENSAYFPEMSDGYSYTEIGWERLLANYGFTMLEYSGIEEYVFRKGLT